MPYGRGGAGNLDLDDDGPEHLTENVKTDQEKETAAEKEQRDVPTSSSASEPAHTGRDGAGTMISPHLPTIASTDTNTSAKASASKNKDDNVGNGNGTGNTSNSNSNNQRHAGHGVAKKGPSAAAHLSSSGDRESRWVGRGGAGNFVRETEAEARARRQKVVIENRLQESVAKNVEAALAKPGKAFLKADVLKE